MKKWIWCVIAVCLMNLEATALAWEKPATYEDNQWDILALIYPYASVPRAGRDQHWSSGMFSNEEIMEITRK